MPSEPTELRDLVILGGGPAGMMAALSAHARGIRSITLIDERPGLGGQVFKQMPPAFRATGAQAGPPSDPRGLQLIREVEAAGIEILRETVVWGLWNGPSKRVAAYGGGKAVNLEARQLVVAAGAYDRPVAFPGWDLPGVITAGAAQTFVKAQRVLPGQRVLLAGTGPLVLAFAVELHRAGVSIAGVLEANPRPGLRQIAALLASALREPRSQFLAGLGYLSYLRSHKIAVRYGYGIKRAEGEDRVSRAVVQRLDAGWNPLPGSEQSLEVDTICLGYGLVSSVEPLRLLGCRMAFDENHGGVIPWRDADFQTTAQGVYAIGDGAGVDGAEVSMLEGRIAGAAIARALGAEDAPAHQISERSARAGLRRYRRFRAALNAVYPIRDGFYDWHTADTLLCRCEEVTFGAARKALEEAVDASALKAATRTGMGPCQARMCSRNVRRLVTRLCPDAQEERAFATPRPPIKPVPLHIIASAETSASRRTEDPR